MKALLIYIVVFFFSIGLTASESPINSLRLEIFALNQNSLLAGELLGKLEKIENPTTLIYAYRGVCQAHIAKTLSNPFEKFFYMIKANKNLSQAVDMDKDNVEVRFLRYAVQIQTPKYLGFQKNIVDDHQIIMKNFTLYDWSRIQQNVIVYICYFMMDTGACTDIEKQHLINFLDSKNLVNLPDN